jgi:hypothetical protein
MRGLRGARAAIGTLLVGALLGYIVSALAGPLVEDSGLIGNGESPHARAYIIGLLQSDPESLAALTPGRGIVARALQFKNVAASQGTITPISLTFLGGKNKNGITVNMYAIEVKNSSGRNTFFPLALTLVGGKVIRRE